MNFTLPGGGMFSTPKAPPPPVDRAAIAEEAAKQRAKELRARRGRSSTILTDPGGGQETGTLQRPTLLGQ